MRAVLALAAVAMLVGADSSTISTWHDSLSTHNHSSISATSTGTGSAARPGMQTYTVSLDKTTFTTVFNYSAALATVVHNNVSVGDDHKKEDNQQHNSTMVVVRLPGTNVTGSDPDNDGNVDSWSDEGDDDATSSRNLKYLWLFFLLLPLALVCIAIFACVRRRRANERRLRRASLRNQALRMDLGSQNMTEPSQDIWYSAFSFRHRQRHNRQASREQNQEEDRDEPLPLYDGHDSSSSPEIRQSTPPVYDEVVGDSSPDNALPRESFELPPRQSFEPRQQSYELSRQMTNPRVSRELRTRAQDRNQSHQHENNDQQNHHQHPQRLSKGLSMHSKEVTEEDETDIDYERGSDEEYYAEGDIGRQRV